VGFNQSRSFGSPLPYMVTNAFAGLKLSGYAA
jgi:hypothetical protein